MTLSIPSQSSPQFFAMTSWSSALCSVWTAKKDRLGTSLIRQLRPLFLCSTSYSRKRGKYLYSLLEKSQISLSFGGKWEYLGKLTITKTSWCRIMISFVDISSSLQALFTLIFRTFGFVSFFKRICVKETFCVSALKARVSLAVEKLEVVLAFECSLLAVVCVASSKKLLWFSFTPQVFDHDVIQSIDTEWL